MRARVGYEDHPVRIDIQSARLIDAARCVGDDREIDRSRGVLPEDAVVPRVGDVEPAGRAERNAGGGIGLERRDGTVLLPCLNAGYDSVQGVDEPDPVVAVVGDVDVAARIDGDSRREDDRFVGRTVVADRTGRWSVVPADDVLDLARRNDHLRDSSVREDRHVGARRVEKTDVTAAPSVERAGRANQRPILRIDDVDSARGDGQPLRRREDGRCDAAVGTEIAGLIVERDDLAGLSRHRPRRPGKERHRRLPAVDESDQIERRCAGV